MFKEYFNNKLQLQIKNTQYFSSIKLTPTARLALVMLVNHLNCDTGLMCPSHKKMGYCLGCNERQAGKALAELERKDIVNVARKDTTGKKYNKYVFTEKFLHSLFDQETLSFWSKIPVKKTVKHKEHDYNNENKNIFNKFPAYSHSKKGSNSSLYSSKIIEKTEQLILGQKQEKLTAEAPPIGLKEELAKRCSRVNKKGYKKELCG